ncbi:MAG: NAD(P)H-dependent oxidoreductase [Phycisphaerales bacterium]|nr:NAD(P)H-dependent oxidoreductase [Phycisphaerales bacterium]
MAESTLKVAIISGSLRQGSFNTALARFVANNMASSEGFEIDEISLGDLDLPMFSEDLEAKGMPAMVLELKDRLIAADAVLIASPEYNGSLSGALKNAIDWASRPREGEAPLACFKGKVGGLLAASPGAIGGLRGLRHVRQILTQLHMVVVPSEFALGVAHEAFDDAGNLKDERAATMAKGVGLAVVEMTKALQSTK